ELTGGVGLLLKPAVGVLRQRMREVIAVESSCLRIPPVRNLSLIFAISRATMLRIVLLLGFTLIAALGPVRSDDRRVALVIGVANYRHAPVLANAANDGADMAKALERLGFEVEYLADADRTAFEAGLRRLGQRARGASASLFYYAGHALELVGRNWLIPSTA